MTTDVEKVDHDLVEVQPQRKGFRRWPETNAVWPNEKALLLIERNEQAPDSRGFRRYQTIFVVRGDDVHKYMEDMGPEILWGNTAFSIPGGDPSNPHAEWTHTVQELKEYAAEMRVFLSRRERDRLVRQAPDLIGQFHDDVDSRDRARREASHFGPNHKVQRTGWRTNGLW